jgi:hypothetical protein
LDQPAGISSRHDNRNPRKWQLHHDHGAAFLGSAGSGRETVAALWSENCNVARRVLAIADRSESRMSPAVERLGRIKPERMKIVRVDFVRTAKQLSREEFCEQLRRILAEQFPDQTVERVSVAADLELSLSRVHVRGICRRGSVRAVVAAAGKANSGMRNGIGVTADRAEGQVDSSGASPCGH